MNTIQGLLKFLASASYTNIYIYANELFPTNLRNTGMGICSMIARVGAILGTFCNDYLVSSDQLNHFCWISATTLLVSVEDAYLDSSASTRLWCFLSCCCCSRGHIPRDIEPIIAAIHSRRQTDVSRVRELVVFIQNTNILLSFSFDSSFRLHRSKHGVIKSLQQNKQSNNQ